MYSTLKFKAFSLHCTDYTLHCESTLLNNNYRVLVELRSPVSGNKENPNQKGLNRIRNAIFYPVNRQNYLRISDSKKLSVTIWIIPAWCRQILLLGVNGHIRTVARKSSIEGLFVCARELDIPKIDKDSTDL